MLTARAIPYRAKPSPLFDRLMTLFCASIAFLVLAMLGMAVFASFASFWPYNLTPSLRHYTHGPAGCRSGRGIFQQPQDGRRARPSLARRWCSVGAYLLEKTKGMDGLRALVRLLAVVPMAVPGWCWAWAISSSSTPPPTRSTGCTTPSRC
jgi:iron(III) transport system permease protein